MLARHPCAAATLASSARLPFRQPCCLPCSARPRSSSAAAQLVYAWQRCAAAQLAKPLPRPAAAQPPLHTLIDPRSCTAPACTPGSRGGWSGGRRSCTERSMTGWGERGHARSAPVQRSASQPAAKATAVPAAASPAFPPPPKLQSCAPAVPSPLLLPLAARLLLPPLPPPLPRAAQLLLLQLQLAGMPNP